MANLVGHYGKYCCFALARGFGRMCAAPSEERAASDTDASASCWAKRSRRDELTTGGKTTCPRPSMEHGTLRPCQFLVCGVRVLDGYETLHGVFEENAHTEAPRNSAQALNFRNWVKEAKVPDTSLSHDGLRSSYSFGMSVSRR